MALKSVLENLDGIDDALKPLYTEDGERFVLDVDGIDDHPEVASLKSAYERVKVDKSKASSERDALQVKLDGIPEDFDKDIWERAKSGNIDEAATEAKIAEIRASLEAERDGYKTELDTLKADNQQKTIRDAVMSALAENMVPEGPRKAAALAMMDGQKVEVSGDDVIVDTAMGPKTLGDYAKTWVAKEGSWAIPDPSGGDAKGGKGSGTDAPKSWGEAKSAKDKVALIKSKIE